MITVLPGPAHVKDFFFHCMSKGGLSKTSGEDRIFIDCSTVDPASSREVANAVHSSDSGKFVDAPMSGGSQGARAGTLTFMLGASTRSGHLIDRVKPVLKHMGKNVWYMGPQGSGVAGKLANNYLLAMTNIATAEAMNIGIRLGLEPKALKDLISSSTGRCWPADVNNPVPGVVEDAPADNDYNGGFSVSLMKKDLGLAVTAAQTAGVRLELAGKAQEIYNAVDKEYKGKDFSVVYRYLGGKE